MGLALQNYHDTHSTFPIGEGFGSANYVATTVQRRAPWTVLILPYLDHANLYSQFDFSSQFVGITSEFPTSGANRTASTTPVVSYHCPSFNSQTDTQRTNYFGVMGGGANLAAWAHSSSIGRAFWENGVLFLNSKVLMRDVTDGTSNTLIVGETKYQLGPKGRSDGIRVLWSSSVRGGVNTTPATLAAVTDVPINAWNGDGNEADTLFTNYTNNDVSNTGTINGTNATQCLQGRAFSSFHVGGCHFAFVDGSVHFISQNIDMGTLQNLAIRNDGNVIGQF